jgi:hypothetical protein
MVAWLNPTLRSLQKSEFHGNIKWDPASLMSQALIWAWQDARDVTDAFSAAQVVCANLKLERVAKTYTTFLNALSRYADQFAPVLRQRLKALMEEVAERRWRDGELGSDRFRWLAHHSSTNRLQRKGVLRSELRPGKTARYRKKK